MFFFLSVSDDENIIAENREQLTMTYYCNKIEVDLQYTYFLRILNLISEFKGLCMFSSRSL